MILFKADKPIEKILYPIKYVVGRNNLALTIFVPYNCPNNCPFCNSKKDYNNSEDFSMLKILESIDKVIKYPFIKDVVITGGEPFANLDQFQILLNHLKPLVLKYHKHLYINTTLPCKDLSEKDRILNFIYNNQKIIDGLNVSRHINFETNYEANDLVRILNENTKIKIRINSVLFGNITKEKVETFMCKYLPLCDNISFRADYTKIKTQDDLRTIHNDSFVNILFNDSRLIYLSSGGCMVCNNDNFLTEDGKLVSYHRGMENSLIEKDNYWIINDIVIKQNGKIVLDWKDKEINLDLLDKTIY